MEIKKVGVVGCGIMGSGIAQVCAQSGYQVVVSEVNDELLNKGLSSISSFLTKGIERGKLSQQDKDSTLARIKGTTNIQDFGDCDMGIEAIIEDMDSKKKIFAELDKICPNHAILATNTSSLSVIDIAGATTRLDKVVGMHFFNPVPIMRLLELVKTIATSDETLETANNFSKSLGKSVIIAKDTPGFIVNRVLVPALNEAVALYWEGIADRDDIDKAIKLGLNWPMGPLMLLDYIGADTALSIAEVLEEGIGPKFHPPTGLKQMVRANLLGRKTGKGFYDWTETK